MASYSEFFDLVLIAIDGFVGHFPHYPYTSNRFINTGVVSGERHRFAARPSP